MTAQAPRALPSPRAAALGRAFTLATPEDRKYVDAIVRMLGKDIPRVEIADMAPPAPAEAEAELGVLEKGEGALGALLGRVDQEARIAVDDLQRDAANVPRHRGARLPQRLGHGQPEALLDGLLHHDVGLGDEKDKYEGFNTPSLVSVFRRVKLLHDGRAAAATTSCPTIPMPG